MKNKVINNLKLYIFVILLGAAVGVILWLFLKAIQLGTEFVWGVLPRTFGGLIGGDLGLSVVGVIACTIGGLLMGLLHWKFGDYPEELPVVLGKIKREQHYDYHPMLVMLACAFLPLVFGASVGPEAGLTGIIAGLCYWIGDNVKYAKANAAEYSDIGAAVMLGTLFHAPLFGIFAVEENEAGSNGGAADSAAAVPAIPKVSKLLLYGLSAGTAFLVMKGLGALFGAVAEGFPGFEAGDVKGADYALILLYIAVGLILFFAYTYSKKLMGLIAGKIPVVLRETVCGLCIGCVALYFPNVLFSGEDQMGMLPDVFAIYAPITLIGMSLLKVVMTTFCIEFGMKGGHFFPLIFACCCMGFGIALLIFGAEAAASHTVLAAAAVTAATMGAQLKKPFAVTMLLLICFPLRLALWIFLAAAIGGKVGGLAAR